MMVVGWLVDVESKDEKNERAGCDACVVGGAGEDGDRSLYVGLAGETFPIIVGGG